MFKKVFKVNLILCFLLFSASCFASIGVEVTPNSWDVTQNEPGGAGAGTWVSSAFTVQNPGTDPAKVNIRGTNTQNWTLESAPGLNIFAMQWGTNPNWNNILTNDTVVVPSLAGSTPFNFNLRYQSPTTIDPITLTDTQLAQVTVSVELANLVATEYVFLRKLGYFSAPQDVALDTSGNIYVTETYNNRIQKFSSDGTFITKWGTQGFGDGQFESPNCIAVDDSGNVYVSDTHNYRIQKFTSDGTFIAKWGTQGSGDGQFNIPCGIAVDDSGNVYVSDTYNYRIQKFSSDGTFITKWGTQGSGDGQFNKPWGIAVDDSGNIYVSDTDNHRIQKFDSNGTFITKLGSQGSGDGQFNKPWGIAVDDSGNVYVSDTYNYRIQKFISDGTFIAKWGTRGSGDEQFDPPIGISVDNSGNVYVADLSGYVKIFTPEY